MPYSVMSYSHVGKDVLVRDVIGVVFFLFFEKAGVVRTWKAVALYLGEWYFHTILWYFCNITEITKNGAKIKTKNSMEITPSCGVFRGK